MVASEKMVDQILRLKESDSILLGLIAWMDRVGLWNGPVIVDAVPLTSDDVNRTQY